jgi:hypothetical protein
MDYLRTAKNDFRHSYALESPTLGYHSDSALESWILRCIPTLLGTETRHHRITYITICLCVVCYRHKDDTGLRFFSILFSALRTGGRCCCKTGWKPPVVFHGLIVLVPTFIDQIGNLYSNFLLNIIPRNMFAFHIQLWDTHLLVEIIRI